MQTIGDDQSSDALAGAADRLRRAVPALARRTIALYVEGAERYTGTDVPHHLERESTQTVRTIMRACIASLTETRPPLEPAITEAAALTVDRVADDLPLEEYMRCWQLSYTVLAEAAAAEIREPALVLHAVTRMREAFDLMARKVADAFAVAARDAAAADSRQDAEVIEALWTGRGWTFAEPDAVPSAPLVTHLHLGPAPGEDAAAHRDRSIARHRKVRQVRAQLRRDFADVWLMDLRARTGRIVSWSHREGLGDAEAAARTLRTLREVTGAEVTTASEPAHGLGDVPRAARVSAAALETGLRLGRTGVPLTMDDLALDHHLGHGSLALPSLLERSRPALSRPELRETVRSFIDHDLDRRATARALHVHPNTVDNRLARVAQLTGLDAHRTRDLLTLAVAALAGDVPEASGAGEAGSRAL